MVTIRLGALAALLAALPIQEPRQPSQYDRDLRSCQAEVKQLRDQLTVQRREYKELEGRIDECQTANRELRSKLGQAGRGDGDAQPPQDCRRLEARLKECETARSNLAKENKDLSNKLAQAGRGGGDEKLRQDYRNLSQEFKNLEGRFDECQSARNNLAAANRDLNKRLAEAGRPAGDFEAQFRTAQATAERYRTQNAALLSEKNQIAGQLADLGRRRDELDRQLQTANLSLQQSRDEIARLSAFRAGQSSTGASGGGSSSQPSQNPGDAQIDRSSARPASHNVGAVLLRSKTSTPQQQQKESETRTWSYDEGGKRHVIRELVIGTLELTYETSIAPGTKVPMEATFTPHPILQRAPDRATEDPILWYIELRFESTRIAGNYNKARSGKPQQRELNPQGGKETWDWELTAPEDFNQDKSAVIVDAGYKEPGLEKEWLPDIAREPLVLSEKETPGAFAVAFRLLKENLTYALGLVSVIFGIWATYVSVKKGKLEVRLKEMELQPKS